MKSQAVAVKLAWWIQILYVRLRQEKVTGKQSPHINQQMLWNLRRVLTVGRVLFV